MTAARAGLRTLLIDSSKFPRTKPCGGGLTARAIKRFPWLPTLLAAIETKSFHRLHLEGPAGSCLRYTSHQPAVITMRRIEFDAALLARAIASGAVFVGGDGLSALDETDDSVRIRTQSGRTFSSKWLIGADGVNGVVSRRAGLSSGWSERDLALDMMEESSDTVLSATDPDVLWVRFSHDGSHGYSYIFPKRSHLNVGVGFLRTWLKTAGGTSPYDRQSRLVAELVMSGRLSGESRRENFTPFHIPIAGPLPRTWRGRILLAGDAGGFVHAVTAEGIYYAMVTGELAALAVATGTNVGRLFEKRWRREIGPELRDALILQRYLFSGSSYVAAIINGAQNLPWVARTAIDYVDGSRSYRSARRSVLLRFPATALRLTLLALRRGA